MTARPILEKDILRHMKSAKDTIEYRRWHIIRLVRIQKMQITQAAKVTGVSRFTIYGALNRFDKLGVEGMRTLRPGGRARPYMSLEEEKKFLDSLVETGRSGLIVTIKSIKTAVEHKLQKGVSVDYVYDILHRHGWRKIRPRPKHPQSNKLEQEEFKKNSQLRFKNACKLSNQTIKGR